MPGRGSFLMKSEREARGGVADDERANAHRSECWSETWDGEPLERALRVWRGLAGM